MLRWLVGAYRPMAGDMSVSGVGRGVETARTETQKLVQSKQNLVDVQTESTPEARKEATLNVLDTVAKLHRNDLLSPEDRQFIVSLHAATAGGGQPTVEQIGKLAQIVEGLRAKLHGPEEVSQVHEAPVIDDAQVEELAQGFREQLDAIISAPDYKEAKRLNHELHQQMDQLLEVNPELYQRVHVALEPDLAAARGHIRAIHQANALELHQAKARHETELAMVVLTLTDPDLSDGARTAWEHKAERLQKAIAEDDRQLAELAKQQAGPLDNRSAAELDEDNARIKSEAQAAVRNQPDIKAMLDLINKAKSGDGQDASQKGNVSQGGVAAAAARIVGGSGQSPPHADPTPSPTNSGAEHWEHLLNAMTTRSVLADQARAQSFDKENAEHDAEQDHQARLEKHQDISEHREERHVQEQKAQEHKEDKEKLDAESDEIARKRQLESGLAPKDLMTKVAEEARNEQQ